MLQIENNPWLGLASYEYKDASRFFGRESELKELKTDICNNPFTTIYGISGAGKTSFINAGMMPLLEKENYFPVRIRLEHESSVGYNTQIIKTVTDSVVKNGGEIESFSLLNEKDISEEERLWYFLFTSKIWSKTNHQIIPVIFIDQFEEIFTKNDDDDTIIQFFKSIDALQYNTPPTNIARILDKEEKYINFNDVAQFRMVFIMREDFLARLEDYSYNIPALRNNRRGIKRMNGHQALEVILNPMPNIVSRDIAIKILGKVTGKVIKDNDDFMNRLSVDTSILSLFCSELYLQAVNSKSERLTVELVNQFGDDIISSFYNNTMKLVSLKTMEYLESHLLTHSGYRNTVAKEDLIQNEIKEEELKSLTEKRLIRIETSEGTERVEFTHDVLCKIAKEHRDNRIQKTYRRTSLFTYGQFILETSILTIFLFYKYSTLFWFNDYMICFFKTFIPSVFILISIFKLWGNYSVLRKKIGAFILIEILLLFLLYFQKQEHVYPQLILENIDTSLHSSILIIAKTIKILCGIMAVSLFLPKSYGKLKKIVKNIIIGILITDFLCVFKDESAMGLLVIVIYMLMPYRFTKERNSRWILLLAIICVYMSCAFCMHVGNEFLLLIVYLLVLIIIPSHYNKHKSFRQTWNYCMNFKVYNDYPFFKKYLVALLLLSTCMISFLIGFALNDIYTLFGIPFLGFISFLLLYYLLIQQNKQKTEEYNLFLKSIFIGKTIRKRLLAKFFVSLIMIFVFLGLGIAQYLLWHIVWMTLLWGSSICLVLYMYYNKSKSWRIWNARKVTFITYFVIWFIPFVCIPILCMGYNIFSLTQYSRVYGKTIHYGFLPDFITIRDSYGSKGLRDRNNLVVPVEYKSIVLYKYVVDYSGWQKSPYYLVIDENIIAELGIFNDKILNTDYYYPSIIFKTINMNGEKSLWNCSDHLDLHNICTTMLLSNYEYRVNTYRCLKDNDVYKYLYSIKDIPNSDIDNKIKITICCNLQNSISNDSIKFNNFEDIDKVAKKIDVKEMISCIESSYRLFAYTNNKSIEKYLLDTVLVKCKNYNKLDVDYAKLSRWRIYARDYKCAERDAITSIKYDSSPHNYAHIAYIESMYFLGKYNRAFLYLDKYIKSECYLNAKERKSLYSIEDINKPFNLKDAAKIYNRIDTVKGDDPFTKRIFVGDALFKDIQDYKKLGFLTDTTSTTFILLISKLKNCCQKPNYDYAQKFVLGNEKYYLCKNYNESGSFKYEFFMYKNKIISPCFYRRGIGLNENKKSKLLVIDINDKKRKYIDFSSGKPTTIVGAFDHAWNFSEGLAVVAVKDKIGVINTKGKYVIFPKYKCNLTYPKDYIENDIYNNWIYNIASSTNVELIFHDGKCPMYNEKTGKYGVINQKGEWIK